MDVMFSIPVYFSSNVSKNIKSIVCKFCEDLNLISYMSVIIGGCKKYIKMIEGSDNLIKNIFGKSEDDDMRRSRRFARFEKNLSSEAEMFLSFRPTYIEISIKTNTGFEQFYVGVKAFPYTVDSAKDLVKILDFIQNSQSDQFTRFLSGIKFKIDKIFGKVPNIIDKITDSWSYRNIVKDSNVAKFILSNRKGGGSVEVLTYGMAFLKYELENLDISDKEIIKGYESMSKKGVGDVFIIDDVSESLIFCNKKLGGCDEKMFSDLATLLNKEDLSVNISGSSVSFSPALRYVISVIK